MTCPKCGKNITTDSNFCNYCGEKTDLSVSQQEQAQNDLIDAESLPAQREKPTKTSASDKIKNTAIAFWKKLSLFGKCVAVATGLFALLGLIAFLAGRIFSGIIAIVAIVTIAVACLMKKGIIKVPKKWLSLLIVLLSFIFVAPYIFLFKIDIAQFEKYNWDELILAEMLPKPASPYGTILSNTEDVLSLNVTKTNERQYTEYINACKDKGFIIDAETVGTSFFAYNSDGYKLSLDYYASSGEMNIVVSAAMKMEKLTWPDNELAKLLPLPKSTIGQISCNNETTFSIYIGNTSIENYEAYIKLCEEKGFTKEVTKQPKSFQAANADLYQLTVNYEGNNIIYISITEPSFDIEFEITCVENWIFSKYDVIFFVDENLKGTIPHGDKKTFSVTLKRGKHTISFESADDDTLDGEVDLKITKDETIKLKISCSSFGVDIKVVSGTIFKDSTHSVTTTTATTTTTKPIETIGAPDTWSNLVEKHYEEVRKLFEDAGFTNVTCVAHEIDFNENKVFEGSVINIAVGPNGENCLFEKGEQWPKDIKIRIDYRVKPAKPDTSQIVLPQENSKLGKDFDSKGTNTVYYINVDGTSNEPKIATWDSATITDGVAEYLKYLQNLGFTVTITDTTHKEPYSGFHLYETNFKISNNSTSWTMYLCIQKEQYVEYELDIHLN